MKNKVFLPVFIVPFIHICATAGQQSPIKSSQENGSENLASLFPDIRYYEGDTCVPYKPPKTNFTAPNRRISQTKCYEYIWQLKVKFAEFIRQSDCEISQIRNTGTVTPVAPNLEKTPFIAGGRSAESGEYPHMGAIGWKTLHGTWVFWCGGTLISPRFVLTAAHCSRTALGDTTVADPSPKIVRLGNSNILEKNPDDLSVEDVDISEIIVHPNYKPPKKYFDIALIKLEREVEFTKKLHPACLWTRHNIRNLFVRPSVTGWGVVDVAERKATTELQTAELDFIDSQKCDELLRFKRSRHWNGVKDHQICAGNLTGGVDACQGDSGGPLQVNTHLTSSGEGLVYHVIGVTSFGIGCARPDLPGIYTRVSSFIDWIESIVWPQ